MIVTVRTVNIPGMSTIGHGTARNERGDLIHFAGDHRPMRAIAEALEAGELVQTELEDWQILVQIPAEEEPE